jgi:hypothetical protein
MGFIATSNLKRNLSEWTNTLILTLFLRNRSAILFDNARAGGF